MNVQFNESKPSGIRGSDESDLYLRPRLTLRHKCLCFNLIKSSLVLCTKLRKERKSHQGQRRKKEGVNERKTERG